MAKQHPTNPTTPPSTNPTTPPPPEENLHTTTGEIHTDRQETRTTRNRSVGIYDRPKTGWPTWVTVLLVIAILIALFAFFF